MVKSIVHRGPDDLGVHLFGPVGLGHTRLSILDLSEHGHQPMHSEAERVTLVYNGEIYNHRELREELLAAGRMFTGHSDSETLLHAYCHWGIDCLERIHGMFAFAIWD